ncbi:hypothetical protein ABFS82_04G144800 [Erythranthe guttata]|uniref:putative late blight resistance protein homolog R1B-16 n=1 Tax=Erythranthe guttata TaxID=4155 RepID=UPI00064DCA80|nr:PREDICTED: putative late blight resistance protein homolog R1B-16 [Erythranthe guttata]|eukprot:XP_012853808.1 PREDICTED: putative late blight resistance protein homolog R1B-16 [Erythranthe guttata]
MAAYAALVSLTNTMDQIQSLSMKVSFLLNFIERDYSHGVATKRAQLLESQIASAASAAEDVIESHVVDQIHGGSITLLDLDTVIQDMDYIKKKVIEFEEEITSGSKDDLPPAYSMPVTTSIRRFIADKNTMVGFDEELNEILDKLTGQSSNRQIIPVVGMGGIGKTTLAKNAYEHSLILYHFDIRTWVTISQNYSVRGILLQLLSRVSIEIDSETDEQLLGEKLYKMLWGRRYLIVVDDIWSIEAWENVKRFFPDNNNGSRVIVTTRLSNVAIHFDGSLCLELNLLDADKSWKLFCESAFGQAGCPPELEDIGMEIVKKCKGLPLSIIVIGGLLRKSRGTQEYWKSIAKDLSSILNSGEEDDCLNLLSLSYTYLPAYLKPCFLYMAIFPEDSAIHVSKLTKIWVAEGFIKPSIDQSLEEIARGYVNDLIDRNLILKHVLGSNGKIRLCKIHDLLRDLCLKIAKKDKFICMMEDTTRGIDGGRRIVLNEGIPIVHHSQVYPALKSTPLTTRTLLIRTDRGCMLPFNNRLLRVCNVSYEFDDKEIKLPKEIFDQVTLRYLRYNTKLNLSGKLPQSISLLWNMQTLIIKGSIHAPSQIWEMRQLRHLVIKSLYLSDPPPSYQNDDIVLRNLHTLKSVVDFEWSEEACKRAHNVKKVNIRFSRFKQRSCQYGLHNLCRLHKLESLKCSSYHQDDFLHNLTFPSSLKKLSLHGSKVCWEDLTKIGSLPHLEVLKLDYMCSADGVHEWNPIEGEFLRLKFLLIEHCDLVYWNADCSHFPVLETLVLRRLHKLEEIPLDIGEIPTLGVIDLYCCNESTAISAMKIAEEQENAGNEGLQVLVVFHEMAQVERFQEKIEQSKTSVSNNFHVSPFIL